MDRMTGLHPDTRSVIETQLMLLRAALQLDNAVKLLDEQLTRLTLKTPSAVEQETNNKEDRR